LTQPAIGKHHWIGFSDSSGVATTFHSTNGRDKAA
jgi:hypothetical protein